MTGDLVERLRAKIAEVEAAIIAYRDGHPGPCLNYEGQDPAAYDEFEPCALHVLVARASPYRDVAVGLRTIQAHREIIARHKIAPPSRTSRGPHCWWCTDGEGLEEAWPCPDVRSIAAIYLPDIETGDTPNG